MSGSRARSANYKPLIFPGFTAMAIHLCTWFPEQVEVIYGGYLYPVWGRVLRTITGMIPISIGDILYSLALFILIRWLIRWKGLPGMLVRALIISCWIYLIFQLNWGLNYSRPAIDRRLGITSSPLDTAHLPALTARLLERTNAYARVRHSAVKPSFDQLVKAAEKGYAVIAGQGNFPVPASVSVKGSMFGVIGNYIGYSGYFNPFTGEAQLNETVPDVLHPFVIAHEIGHQLGFAREQEANLTGFLAARASGDSLMRYSAYFDMFLYANAVLSQSDSTAARRHLNELSPAARKDLQELRNFRLRYRTWLEDLTDWWYDHYLKMNGQEAGGRSYGLVVRTLLSLYAKAGDI